MDLNGHRTVIPITMAELAILVVTPTPEGSVRFDRHAMGAAGDGRHPIAVRTDARRHEPTGLAAIADASVGIVAPAPQRAVCRDGQIVGVARRDRSPGSANGQLEIGRASCRERVCQYV